MQSQTVKLSTEDGYALTEPEQEEVTFCQRPEKSKATDAARIRTGGVILAGIASHSFTVSALRC